MIKDTTINNISKNRLDWLNCHLVDNDHGAVYQRESLDHNHRGLGLSRGYLACQNKRVGARTSVSAAFYPLKPALKVEGQDSAHAPLHINPGIAVLRLWLTTFL